MPLIISRLYMGLQMSVRAFPAFSCLKSAKRKEKGNIKHNLTETANKYKVQNSVSKIKNVLIQKQLEEAFKPVVMQSLLTSLASKCSKLKTHIQSLNCRILNKIRLINNIIISVFLLSAYVRLRERWPHAPNASK